MFPIIIPIQTYPQYIKKAELEEFLQKSTKEAKIRYIVVIIGLIIAQLIVSLLVMSKMYSLYNTLNQAPQLDLPFIVIASILSGLIFIIVVLTSNPLDTKAVETLRQDKENLITIKSSFVNKTLLWFVLSYVIISFAAILFAVILPIYGLASFVETN